MIYDDFASAVLAERKARRYSQKKMGESIQTTAFTINSWEHKDHIPKNFLFNEFCNKYNYKIEIDGTLVDLEGLTEWCRNKRIERNLSQSVLSRMCGYEKSYIANEEHIGFNIRSADVIPKALGYTVRLVKAVD